MIERNITAHGGTLSNLMVSKDHAAKLTTQSKKWRSLDLSQRQLCDLELLLSGGFSPLQTFMGEADYKQVLSNMRLTDGTLWPIPITLDADSEFATSLKKSRT